MEKPGPYDADIHQFIDPPREPRINHLRDLRLRAEKGEFGPKPISIPRGAFVFRLTVAEIHKYAMQQGDAELKPQSARELHMAEMGSD